MATTLSSGGEISLQHGGLPQILEEGERIGRYIVREPLGVGGIGGRVSRLRS